MKDQKYLSDSHVYKPPKRSDCSKPCSSHSRRSISSVSPSPTPERMRLVHPGGPPFTGVSPGLCLPLQTGGKEACATESIIICCPAKTERGLRRRGEWRLIKEASSEFLSRPFTALEQPSSFRGQTMPQQSAQSYSILVRKRQPQVGNGRP